MCGCFPSRRRSCCRLYASAKTEVPTKIKHGRGPAAFTCSPTFDGTFGPRRQHGRTRKSRLGHSKKKKGLARRTCPNKRVNEETDSRRVEEKENNLRRHIKREEAREAKEE